MTTYGFGKNKGKREVYTKEEVDALKNIITVGLLENLVAEQCPEEGSTETLWELYKKITGLEVWSSVGEKLKLENNSIVIGKGVSKVKVSCKASWYSEEGSVKYAAIFKNYDRITWASPSIDTHNYGDCSMPDVLIDVAENDVISFSYHTRVAGSDVIMGERKSYITVEAVK